MCNLTPEYVYIDSTAALEAFARTPPQSFGFDTEFTREKTFYPIPELLQLEFNGRIGIVDLRVDLSLDVIKTWFIDAEIVRSAYSISNDIEVLNLLVGKKLGPIEDIQLALAFARGGSMQSYAKVVQSEFGITLQKSMQRSRWG